MLIESPKGETQPNQARRRWFSDADFDLILWGRGEVYTRFQLCYDKRKDEHALLWDAGKGFDHYRVDGGEASPLRNLSPMLEKNHSPGTSGLRQAFEACSREIDPRVRAFVLGKLDELAQHRALRILGEVAGAQWEVAGAQWEVAGAQWEVAGARREVAGAGGVYLLWVRLNRAREITFGRYGQGEPVPLPPGWYVYVGSARGKRGAATLANRLLRHASRSGGKPPHAIRAPLIEQLIASRLEGKLPKGKTPHWHIDYLLDLEEAELRGVLAIPAQDPIERRLAEWLSDRPEARVFAPGLGAGDHPGGTHLLRVAAAYTWWEELPNRVVQFLTKSGFL